MTSATARWPCMRRRCGTHSYSYDIAGNRTRADYGTGRSVQTSYDALNRPESIVEGSRATRYGYDLGGRAVILMAGNGQVTSNSYDALGRLKERTLYRNQSMGQADVMAQFSWEHDLLGNVTTQSETWSGEATRPGTRTTSMAYDANNRLIGETITDPSAGVTVTTYAYDAANNRTSKQVTGGTEPGLWSYVYNAANQLTSWEKSLEGTPVKTAALTYDAAGNRIAQSVTTLNLEPETLNTQYTWDAQDRLATVTMPDGAIHDYEYDYRTRRIETGVRTTPSALRTLTAILFAGGLSLAEYDATASPSSSIENPASSIVQYVRGPDMGGGVGGMLYSLRGGTTKYSLSNGRGDIVAQADQGANLTWTASYEAYGKRTKETGTNLDKQRANSKDEDPTGLLNEGFRYRDIETGVWLSRDPAGFVDGPNLYAYVKQNPWTGFDPKGLAEKRVTKAGHTVEGKGHHLNPAELWDKQGFTDKGAHEIFDKATVPAPDHNFTAHGSKTGYTAQVEGEFDAFKQDWATKNKAAANVGEMSAKQQQQLAQEFVEHIKPVTGTTTNGYIKGFNEVVGEGPAAVAKWEATTGRALFKPMVASESVFVAASGRKVPYLSYAGRGLAKVAVVGSVILGGAAIANAGQTEGAKGALIESTYQLSSIVTMGSSDLCRAVGDVQTWHMEQSKDTQSAGSNSYYGWMGGFSYW